MTAWLAGPAEPLAFRYATWPALLPNHAVSLYATPLSLLRRIHNDANLPTRFNVPPSCLLNTVRRMLHSHFTVTSANNMEKVLADFRGRETSCPRAFMKYNLLSRFSRRPKSFASHALESPPNYYYLDSSSGQCLLHVLTTRHLR